MSTCAKPDCLCRTIELGEDVTADFALPANADVFNIEIAQPITLGSADALADALGDAIAKSDSRTILCPDDAIADWLLEEEERGLRLQEEVISLLAEMNEHELGVVLFLARRLAKGRKVYGALNPHDGRNWPLEALEEAVDMGVYLTAALFALVENKNGKEPNTG